MDVKWPKLNREGIPPELKKYAQWVVWKFGVSVSGNLTKYPYCAGTGEDASLTDSSTWSSYEEAIAAYESGGYDGIGFMLTKGDPYVVIKLRGAVAPSGDDIHIWVRGHKPAGAGCIGGPDGKLGVYDCERMIPVTGERPIDTPRTIERRQAPVDELCKQLSGSEPPIEPPASGFKRLVDSNGKLQGFLEE